MNSILAAGLALLSCGVSLTAANLLSDRGAPAPVSRWVAGSIGGFGYLAAITWLDVWMALSLSAAALLAISALRMYGASHLRGLRGSAPSGSRAELGYPAAATLAIAIGWGALGQPRLALLPIAFMAWGDASAGLARWLAGARLQAAAASTAMLAVSLACVAALHAGLAGVIAALGATAAEGLWPLTRSRISDNWPVAGSALGLLILIGGTR
jgi:hypothetical protein